METLERSSGEMQTSAVQRTPLRIVVVGEQWKGSTPASCVKALSKLGHTAINCNTSDVFPRWTSRVLRAGLRLLDPLLVAEYNRQILASCSWNRPEAVLVIKGIYIQAGTLRAIREMGIQLYNYYPDTSLYTHHPALPATIPEYDCLFFTKRHQTRTVREQWKARDSKYLPHGFDAAVHRPIEISSAQKKTLGCDVVYVATHTPYKESVLRDLVKRLPSIRLKIYGNGWNKQGSPLAPYVMGWAPTGDMYSTVLCSADINLAIMSGKVKGAPQGDETTTRTFQITACGGFMLHERSSELKETFEEGREVACFEGVDELAEKIEYYLARPEERQVIAQAGYRRCVPAYSYESRMNVIVDYHRSTMGSRAAHA